MTNNIAQAAEYGFLKRAMEYGMTEVEARVLLKEKRAGILDSIKERFGGAQQAIPNPYDAFKKQWESNAPEAHDAMTAGGAALFGGLTTGPGALIGAGAGGLIGGLNSKKDEKGETHYLRDILSGAGLGGGIGAGLGWGAGALTGGVKGNNMFHELNGRMSAM